MRTVFLLITLIMLSGLTFAQATSSQSRDIRIEITPEITPAQSSTSAQGRGCTAILVSDNPADFAVATVFAEKLNLDTMVTPWGVLSNESVQEIRASKCSRVYVIGGPVAVPGAGSVLSQYNIAVERIGGGDRFETSALVAERWDSSPRVFVAGGYDEQGISDAAEQAKAKAAPIVFVKAGGVPQAVASAIAKLGVKEAILVPAPDMDAPKINASIDVEGVEIIKTDFEQMTQIAIDKAEAAVLSAETNINEITDAKSVAASRLLEKAKERLSYAKEAYDSKEYSRAFGQAVSAQENAENSMRISSGIVVGYLQKAVDTAKADMEALVKSKKIDIGEIVRDPVKYEGREVQVTGGVLSDPVFIGGKTYIELQDAAGRIFVEKEGFIGPPLVDKGDTITVTGRIRINPEYGGHSRGEHASLPSYIIEATEIERV